MLSDGKKRQQCKRGRHRGHHQNLSERPLFLLFSDNMATAILSEKSRNLKKMSFLTTQKVQFRQDSLYSLPKVERWSSQYKCSIFTSDLTMGYRFEKSLGQGVFDFVTYAFELLGGT